MTLTFLGTSHGIPEKERMLSSAVLNVGGSLYIIDAGAPVASLLTKYGFDFNCIKGVFITHCHGDHLYGLAELLDQLSWVHTESNPTVYLPEDKIIPAVTGWVNCCCSKGVRTEMKVYSEGTVYSDGNITLTAHRTEHVKNSYAFTVECEGKKVLFTGDMGHNFTEYPRIAGDIRYDAIIAEGAHFALDGAYNVYKNCNTDVLILNHVNPEKSSDLEPLKDCKEFNTVFAQDGMEIEI